MRNAFKSWDKSDSGIDWGYEIKVKDKTACERCTGREWCDDPFIRAGFVLGKKDKQLLLNLCKAGDPSHRKVLRQLPVMFDITAPLYFWKQLDTYKVGTTANSESTMHTLVKEPFKLENFEVQHFLNIDGEETNWLKCTEYEDSNLWFEGMENHGYCFSPEEYFKENFINLLNSLRCFYLKTKDQNYWYAINELLPQSYNQTRTWSGNYEVLLNMIQQRRGHKLGEWKTFSDYMLEHVPYLSDIYDAINKQKKQQRESQNTNRSFMNVWER